ncbi:hypothetical protein EDB86DRAFT_610965 [Lactarius hatsudake]|nr:hypothetical protein EDB86DRAFT_610965 [Lactarius hatsudake]
MADEHEQDDSDDSEIEIIVDAPRGLRRLPRANPQSQPPSRPQDSHKPRRSAQRHRASTPPAVLTFISVHTSRPESTLPPQEQSSPLTPPDVNSLAGLPVTILPEHARPEIAIPPWALSHLHSSSDHPEPVRKMQEMQQHAIRQGIDYEAAAGAHGLLTSLPAAELEPTPASDSGACATTINSPPASMVQFVRRPLLLYNQDCSWKKSRTAYSFSQSACFDERNKSLKQFVEILKTEGVLFF